MSDSILDQSVSFDSNLEYYVGLFMSSDLQKSQPERKSTIPDPFHFVSSERYGERSYSTSAMQRKHSSAPRARAASQNGSMKNVRPPKLSLMQKKGERVYSSFAGSNDNVGGVEREHHRHSSQRPMSAPKLRLTEKFGDRVYSNFAGNFDRNVSTNRRSSSRQRHAKLLPPRLTLNERRGQRHYSLFASNSSDTLDRRYALSKNIRPPKLRLLEKHGERHYSTSSPNKELTTIQSWNGPKQLTLTVPMPFHLSSSPLKFTQRARQNRDLKFRFKALPLPDFSKIPPLGKNTGKNKNIYTVPSPFHLSETNRGERSSSPPSSRESVSDQKIRRVRTRRNKVLRKFPSKTNRKSIKSKHRFAIKHHGKVLKNGGIPKKDPKSGSSINPNLNASRAAREKYLLGVAAEVAKLREEWQRYKEEAQKISDEIEKANYYKTKLQRKLLNPNNEDVNLESIREQLKKLDMIIDFKSEQLQGYNERLVENEKKQRIASTRYKLKRKEAEIDGKAYQPVLIFGRQRSIRRVMSFKKRNSSIQRQHSVHMENNGVFELSLKDQELQNSKIYFDKSNRDDNDEDSNDSKDNDSKDNDPTDTTLTDRKVEDIDSNIDRQSDILSQFTLENDSTKEKFSNDQSETDLDTDKNSDGSNSMKNACAVDSRDPEDETSSQSVKEVEKSLETRTEKPLERRPKGDFGDDFDISPLTTMFRGGWQRALSHEHLAKKQIESKVILRRPMKARE